MITSNFEKLRFYIDNSIDYEEFNLFTLDREQFNLLYLCLNLQSIQQHLPKRLKDESVSQEDAITKKLYKDYSEFKRALDQNLVGLNPEYDKLLLFKKTQKLLDRFLFIFLCGRPFVAADEFDFPHQPRMEKFETNANSGFVV